MESYSFRDGEDISIDVSSNKTIYNYWVELVIVKDGDIALGMHTYTCTYICMYMYTHIHTLLSPIAGPYPVVFSGSGGLSAMVTIPFSSVSAIYADGSTFTIQLRNTADGGAFFSRQEASLRIVIDGGAYTCIRVCVCVCACVRACVHACVRVCVLGGGGGILPACCFRQ